MFRIIQIVLVGVFTSFFFFPFVPTFLPVGNTKIIMAALGLLTLGINISKGQKAALNVDLLTLSVLSLLVSLISYVSITLNETRDYVFVSYFVSMWVWLAAAYFVLQLIKNVHGNASIEVIGKYLIGISVVQCVLALTMDQYLPLKRLVDSLIEGEGFMGKNEDRLYGIGCALDVAGLKFSAVLIILANLIGNLREEKQKDIKWFIGAFVIITVIGNMISRTTIIGVALSLLYMIYLFYCNKEYNKGNINLFFEWLVGVIVVLLPCVILLYNNNHSFHENFRFAFEGFFSLVETGEWQTHSNDILKNMVVFPDNLHTWLIGDGYFNGPSIVGTSSFDPYYIGRNYGYFYKGTDIGYLRYIFYYGIVGLITFSIYFIKATQICIKYFHPYKMMFLMILLMNFIGWFKVSSDLFPVFAIFLVSAMDYDKENLIYQNR